MLSLFTIILLIAGSFPPVYGAVIGPERKEMDTKGMTVAYFREHKHLVSYETCAKVFFTLSLPSINAMDPGNCDADDVACFAEKTAFNLKLELDDFVKQMESGKSRRKRQASLVVAGVVGYMMHTIFSKFSKKIFGTDEEAQDMINEYRTYLVANSQDHLYFNASIQSLAKGVTAMSSTYWFFDRKVDKRDKALLFLSQVQAAVVNYQLGIERCVNRRIPMQFIPSWVLKKKLLEVEASLVKQGYHLSIPIGKLNEYYKMSICDCMFSNTTGYIQINIPAEKLQWNIFDFIPVNFAHENKTCALKGSDNLIAVSKARVEVIDPKMSPFCDTLHDSLCYIPSFTFHMQTCAQSIYSGDSFENILNSCEMKCKNNSLLHVVNVDTNIIIVTNGNVLQISCNDRTMHYKLNHTGATEIFVKCSCSYNVDGVELDLRAMCGSGRFEDSDVKRIVPNIAPNNNLLQNNVNSSITMPEYVQHILPNASSYTPIVLPSPNESGLHYRDIWLLVVSTMLTIVSCGCVVFCIWLCKKQN